MNLTVVQNAVGEFRRMLGKPRHALGAFEAARYGSSNYYSEAAEALAVGLDDLQQRLMVLLDAADMRDTRTSLDAAWVAFKANSDGLGAVVNDDECERSYSPALNYIERVLETLFACVDSGLSSAEAVELDRLEWILGRTAVLVHGRGETISGELQLQGIMHDYLWAAFPDFVRKVSIPGGLKNFEPDCGIRNLSAAVEFKVIHSRPEVARAISGVIEDIGGYRGSKDWTRFYSVFFQAHPYITEAQVRRELRRAGGSEAWTPIVVTEPTNPKEAKNVQPPGAIVTDDSRKPEPSTRRARIAKRVR
jgi:hypothetical protein